MEITLYDTVDYLDCTEARIEYLRGALEEGDKEDWKTALLNIAKSLGITYDELLPICIVFATGKIEKLEAVMKFALEQLCEN